VQGTVADSFFQRFRGGYFPDKVASKGLLCALVRRGGERRAFIATHFHNAASDRFGGARAHQVEQLANAVKWIDANWRAPITMLGDFNIDSLAAYKSASDVERTLYSRLALAGRSRDRPHFDVNAQCNGFVPRATSTESPPAIARASACCTHRPDCPAVAGCGAPPACASRSSSERRKKASCVRAASCARTVAHRWSGRAALPA